MVECQLPKLRTRVRFPSLALFFFYLTAAGILSGCATITPEESVVIVPPQGKKGVYHKVRKGETLWRIAKTYEVSLDEIITVNKIPDVAQVEESQLVFISGAESVKTVPSLKEEKEKDFQWPFKGRIIKFFRDSKSGPWNKGIDIGVDADQEVKAARAGRVVFADFLNGYGNMIILDHLDGFHSVYAHNAQLKVQVDEMVSQQDVIALAGSNPSKQAYIHFEIRKNSVEDNPLYYLP